MATISQFLLEFDSYDDTDGVVVERFCTGSKFITKKSETPSLAKYLPLLVDAGFVEEFLFGKSRTTGSVSSSSGRITLNNGSGRLDYLLDRGLDGRTITVRERLGDSYPDDFPIRFQGVIEGRSFSSRTITLDVKSKLFEVRREVYQPIKYAGTNDGATIYLEGTEDLEGSPKPKLIGDGSNGNNVATLVDAPNEIYQLSSEPCTINNVYVGRAVITAGTQFTTLAAFIASVTTTPPTAGTYDYYEGDYPFDEGDNERGCYIAFGTTPNLSVTFDASEGWANECLQSEDFDTTWTATDISGGADGDLDPNGQPNAYSFEKYIIYPSVWVGQDITLSGAVGDYYTISVFAKIDAGMNDIYPPKPLSTITLGAVGSATRAMVEFNLVTGATNTVTNNLADTSKLNPILEDLGNDWFRVSMTFDSDSATTNARIYAGEFSTTEEGTILVWGAQVERYQEASPYTPTTTTAVISETAMCNVWKVMNHRGFALGTLSSVNTDYDNDAPTGFFSGTSETTLGVVIDLFANSIKAYVADTISGGFISGVFKVPTVGEVVKVIDASLLFNDPKLKMIRAADFSGGTPVYRSTANWGHNGLVMDESQVVGASLGDISFVSEEWRGAFKETTATITKHLNALEDTFDTALTVKSDAEARSQFQLDLYDTNRLTIEIHVPTSVGFDLLRGDVIQVSDRVYRIIGKTTKFPNTKTKVVSTNLITFQAWGGVKI